MRRLRGAGNEEPMRTHTVSIPWRSKYRRERSSPKDLDRPYRPSGRRGSLRGHHFVLPVEAGHVVGAGEHHPLHPLLARGFIQVVGANDVGLQDGRPGLLGGDPAQVHHRVHLAQQLQHGVGVFQPGRLQFFAFGSGTQVGHVGQAQPLAIGLQALAQFTAQAAGGAGQQQALETDGGGVAGHVGSAGLLGTVREEPVEVRHLLSYNANSKPSALPSPQG